jgi:hypothetical protein
LLLFVFCGCSSKKTDDFDLENHILEFSNIGLPEGFLLKSYSTNESIKKDTSYNGKFIRYSLSTDSTDIVSFIILHNDDSLKIRYYTLIHNEILSKTGCNFDEKYSTFAIKVFKETNKILEDITNKVFVNNNINEDIAKINNDCNKIVPIPGYDSLAFVLNNITAVFNWTGSRYQYVNNGDEALLTLNSCHDYCTDINSIELNLSDLKKVDYKLPDTFIHVYAKYRTISKIKAELPDEGTYEFYFNNFPNNITSQKDLFCCKISKKNDTEFNFFESGIFSYRVTPNLDTIRVKSSFDLLFDDTRSINIYNLSQKSINQFSINNNAESYAKLQNAINIVKVTDQEYSSYSKTEKKFNDPQWPIDGVITSYKNNGELKLLYLSYNLTDNIGTNVYIYLDNGQIICTKTWELSNVIHEANEDGTQNMTTTLSDDKMRFYSNNKLIGWISRPLFVNQEYSYSVDQYYAKVTPEICFSNDFGEMEGEYPPTFWLEFNKSKLSIGQFAKKWEKK